MSIPYYRTSEYRAWINMLRRCYNPSYKQWKDYGGRGITVCDEWRYSFENFINDIGYKPNNKLTLDRINNDGNYEPSNCRWATMKVQIANRRKYIVKNNINNTSGTLGIRFRKDKNSWVFYTNINGIRYEKYSKSKEVVLNYREQVLKLKTVSPS